MANTVECPVCGQQVDPDNAPASDTYDDQTSVFSVPRASQGPGRRRQHRSCTLGATCGGRHSHRPVGESPPTRG